VVKLDPETIELHFALGNLFRRRGESDRAIRVHLNLAERSDLDSGQREQALFELGQDYLKAGLLDRAEDAFNRLAQTQYAGQALRHRMAIAQMVRDWPLAIDLAQRLGCEAGQASGSQIAHFRCELAARALESDAADRHEQAALELKIAAEQAPNHPRPLMMAGELAARQQDPARAIKLWSEVCLKHPAFLGLISREWLAAHQACGKSDAGIDALIEAYSRSPSVDMLVAIAEAMHSLRGESAAIAWIGQQLVQHPSLIGLEALLALRAQNDDLQGTDTDQVTQRVIGQHTKRLARYVCNRCGFKARTHYWQCPGCSRWDTYAPRRMEELER
ncbi:MAG: lipopolysaccharide assembly protein LapB, partial [Quisquiliibacterium sp.]